MIRIALHLLTLLAAIGCDKPASPAPAPAAKPGNPSKPATTAPSAFGTVRGKVILTGWVPRPLVAQMIDCCGKKIPLVREDVKVALDGSLEDVVIYLKDAPPSTTTTTPAPAVLDQIQCAYVPHVLAMRTGQTLTIKSSDDTLHNIHSHAQINPAINIGMYRPGSHDVVFKLPEIFRVKCDVHPWMMAHIAVFSHPWFAVSAKGGKFQIGNLPAGPQTLVAWHNRFGEIEQTVTVTTDQAREITFNFEPPKEK
jgi:hypothetical protein